MNESLIKEALLLHEYIVKQLHAKQLTESYNENADSVVVSGLSEDYPERV